MPSRHSIPFQLQQILARVGAPNAHVDASRRSRRRKRRAASPPKRKSALRRRSRSPRAKTKRVSFRL